MSTSTINASEIGLPKLTRPVLRVMLLSVAMIAASVSLLFLDGNLTVASMPSHWWVAVFIACGFAAATRFPFHVEFRRNAITFSMTEAAAALALAFLSPIGAFAVRVVVSLPLMLTTSRTPAYKQFFNVALFAFNTAVAFAIVRSIAGTSAESETRFLIGVAIALTLTGILDALLVAMAISCFEGGLRRRLINVLRAGLLVSLVSGLVAAMTVAPALVRPELVLLAIVPVAALWYVLRQFGHLAQNHRDLSALHGFAGVVAQSLDLEHIADTALCEVTQLLRADRGHLDIFDPDGTIVATNTVGAAPLRLPIGPNDARWSEVFGSGDAVPCGLGPDGMLALDGGGRRRALAVPILDDAVTIGIMMIADRGGAVDEFGPDDLSRAKTLASHLAASVRRAFLHASMEKAALHDALTGKPNRLAFERALRESTAAGEDDVAAVLMLDLDRFKEVNDTLGHHVGDRVLIEFARRVESRMVDGDAVARFGGDEFAVFARRPTREEIEELAQAIHADSFAPMKLDDLDVVVTASIGVAPFDDDVASVMRQADIAMYSAKRERSGVEWYRDEIDRRSPERLSLLGGLRDAIENGALEVHYQPKVDLVTATVIGAEALVRWCHPSRGWISPVDFIQVAEESGLIKQVTDQVATIAITAAREWRDAGYDLGIAVNLSAHDLLDDQLPHRIERLLAMHGLPADRLTLEITESALLSDTPRTSATIGRLDELGVHLSLDDFGTGYSSLGYLRRLPVTELKVDRSFVTNLLLDAQDEVIVRSTIDLGHNLGLQVVAEGIENMPTLERLNELGCDIGQGFGISRPLAPEHFATWLRTTEYAVRQRHLNSI